VHYKHLRPSVQLPHFKLFSYLTHMFSQHSRDTVIRLALDFIVNWHVPIQILLEVSLSLKLLVYWKEFLLKICLKMKDVKENSVQ